MKDRLRAPSTDFGNAPPLCITGSSSCITAYSIANKIDIGMVIICRPMTLKVLQKGSPIERQTMLCEVPERERKAVVDADKRRDIFGQNLRQPFCDPATCPILPRTKGRLDFNRRRVPVRYVYTQAFEACHRGFRTGVVHPDIPFECQWHVQAITSDNSVWASP